MSAYLLDTHTWVWDLKLDENLPSRVISLIDSATSVHLSVVSLYEITQKVRLGKWHEMSAAADRRSEILDEQGYLGVDVSAAIAQCAGLLEWDHRDPFDRIIAATSIIHKLPLISADTAFDALAGREDWPGRIW